MMKKTTIISLISALSCTGVAFAGSMGDVGAPCFTSFIALEGGFSDNTIDQYNLTISGVVIPFTQTIKNQGTSGRISVGAGSKVEEFAATGEIGWGYYGRTTIDIAGPLGIATFSNAYTLTGFDILAGIAWVPGNWILYLKAGAMIENMSNSAELTLTQPGSTATFALDSNRTMALPEVKIGAGYSFADNWAITVSGLYVIGTAVKASGTVNLGAINTSNVTINNRNTSIAAVLVGLQFSI